MASPVIEDIAAFNLNLSMSLTLKWRRYATGRTLSTVETLFGRQLGFPNYARSSDSMSNGWVEKMLGRQMVNGRTEDACGDVRVPRPIQMSRTKTRQRGNHTKHEREAIDWMKLDVRKSCRIMLADTVLWETKNDVGGKCYYDSYYIIEPDPAYVLKFLEHRKVPGKMEEFEVNAIRVPGLVDETVSTYLYTLTEGGHVRAYDVCKKRVVSDLRLKSSLEGLVRFTGMVFDTSTGKIYVIASANGYIKSIYIVKHPPWFIDNIIHIKVPLRMELFEFGGMILNPNSIEIIDLEHLTELAEETDVLISQSQTGCWTWPGVFEKEVNMKPTQILEKLSTTNAFFGILDCVWPPLYYAKSNHNITIGRFDSSIPLWELNTANPLSINAFIPLPDESPSILLLTDDDYELLNLKRVDKDMMTSHEVSTSKPFEVEGPPARVAPHPHNRPRRAAASQVSYAMHSDANCKVLGVAYNGVMELIAVFTSTKQDLFVTLYETNTFKLFKRLPPVRVWPMRRRRSKHSKDDEEESVGISRRDEIERFVVEFDYETMFIYVKYRHDAEVLLLRALNEY